jgi:2-C-methyl-D-erythritol 4-phosphate cytidylyltransferase
MGEETNLKITTKQDLAIAEFILNQRSLNLELQRGTGF